MTLRSEAATLMIMASKDIELLRFIVSSASVADEIFGFHAQQAAEKALKAWLIFVGGTLDRVHDLRRLLIFLQDLGQDVEQFRELISLNSFAVQFRYEAMEQEDVPLDRVGTLTKVEALYTHVQSMLGSPES